jgi:hypothetical protein
METIHLYLAVTAKARQALRLPETRTNVPPQAPWHCVWKVGLCRTEIGRRLFMITNAATLFTLFADRTPPCGAAEGLRRITSRIESCLSHYDLPLPSQRGAVGLEFVVAPNPSLTGVMNRFTLDLEYYGMDDLRVLEESINQTPVLTWGYPEDLFRTRLAGDPKL